MYVYAIALKAAAPLCSRSGHWPDCYTRSANAKYIELLLLSACAFLRSPFVTTSSSNQHHSPQTSKAQRLLYIQPVWIL